MMQTLASGSMQKPRYVQIMIWVWAGQNTIPPQQIGRLGQTKAIANKVKAQIHSNRGNPVNYDANPGFCVHAEAEIRTNHDLGKLTIKKYNSPSKNRPF